MEEMLKELAGWQKGPSGSSPTVPSGLGLPHPDDDYYIRRDHKPGENRFIKLNTYNTGQSVPRVPFPFIHNIDPDHHNETSKSKFTTNVLMQRDEG